jgi:hypothetical protein
MTNFYRFLSLCRLKTSITIESNKALMLATSNLSKTCSNSLNSLCILFLIPALVIDSQSKFSYRASVAKLLTFNAKLSVHVITFLHNWLGTHAKRHSFENWELTAQIPSNGRKTRGRKLFPWHQIVNKTERSIKSDNFQLFCVQIKSDLVGGSP